VVDWLDGAGLALMDIDVDPNVDGDSYIYQLADGRFFLVVSVDKSRLGETRKAVLALRVGEEAVFGAIGCGERVWIARDESGYLIAIGDTDSKDVWYRITEPELHLLLNAEAS
jgi:hypothetical protein